MLRIINQHRSFILFCLLIFVCLNLNLLAVVPPSRLTGDDISLLLTASAPARDLGVPYKDYWVESNPGIILFLSFWVKFLGSSMASLKILELLTFIGISLFIYLILKKIFSTFYVFLIGGLTIITMFSPYLNFLLFSPESIGLLFSLAGLVSLLYLRGLKLKFFLSTLFFTISGQIHDLFALTILTILPSLIALKASSRHRNFLVAIASSFFGFLLVNSLISLSLFSLGSYSAYLEVLQYKLGRYSGYLFGQENGFFDILLYTLWHSKNIIVSLQHEIGLILMAFFVSFVLILFPDCKLSWPKKKVINGVILFTTPSIRLTFTKSTVNINMVMVFLYSFVSLVGLNLWSNFDFRFLLQMVPAIFLFWAIVLKSTFENLLKFLKMSKPRFLLVPLLILFLFPKGSYLSSYFVDWKISRYAKSEPLLNKQEDYLVLNTRPSECILSLYGWNVAQTYFYAQRKPCTRFFQPSLNTLNWQREEYQASLLQNPPRVIVYTREGANLDVDLFERKVFNFSKVLKQCYYPSTDLNLYSSKYSLEELKSCLMQNYL